MDVFDWRSLIPFVFIAPLLPLPEPEGRAASRIGSAGYVAILLLGAALIATAGEVWAGAGMFRGLGTGVVFLLASTFRLRHSVVGEGGRREEFWRGFIPSLLPLAALVWTWAAWGQVSGRPELPEDVLEELPEQRHVESWMVAGYALAWLGSLIAYVVLARRERAWAVFGISQAVIAWLLLETVQGLRIGEARVWFAGATVAAMIYFKWMAGTPSVLLRR
jgi:hypothetical protein